MISTIDRRANDGNIIGKQNEEKKSDIGKNCNLDKLTYQLEHVDWLWIACYFSEVNELMLVSATREPYIPRAIFKKSP